MSVPPRNHSGEKIEYFCHLCMSQLHEINVPSILLTFPCPSNRLQHPCLTNTLSLANGEITEGAAADFRRPRIKQMHAVILLTSSTGQQNVKHRVENLSQPRDPSPHHAFPPIPIFSFAFTINPLNLVVAKLSTNSTTLVILPSSSTSKIKRYSPV
jgi:hypothetical protein